MTSTSTVEVLTSSVVHCCQLYIQWGGRGPRHGQAVGNISRTLHETILSNQYDEVIEKNIGGIVKTITRRVQEVVFAERKRQTQTLVVVEVPRLVEDTLDQTLRL